jgi:hypothetical protein
MRARLALTAVVLGVMAPTAVVADVTFKPEIISSTPESRARLVQNLKIADRAVLAYVHRSVLSIQQGHRDGFAQFRTWYRKRDAAEQERQAQREVLAGMFGSLLSAGLNIAIPGSGGFVDALKDVTKKGMETAVAELGKVDKGDVNRFLDEHQARLEGVITGLLDVPEQFRTKQRRDFEDARTEYVFEMEDTAAEGDELPPHTKELLAAAGVPEPGSATAIRVRDDLLAAQINALLLQSEPHLKMHSTYEISLISQVEALKHLYPKQSDRYCPVEAKLQDFWRTPECRAWIKSH